MTYPTPDATELAKLVTSARPADALERRDVGALANFAPVPRMPCVHPASEHYTRLFVALGAGNDSSPVQNHLRRLCHRPGQAVLPDRLRET